MNTGFLHLCPLQLVAVKVTASMCLSFFNVKLSVQFGDQSLSWRG